MKQVRTFESFLRLLRRSTDQLREDPVREEIFSVERLEAYAKHLATELRVATGRDRGRSLLPDSERHGRRLQEAYLHLAAVVRSKKVVSPAAECFVDNFHVIDDQIRQIHRDLPKHYHRELPKLAEGELAGLPRVYAIALGIIAHSDSRLDAEALRRYLQAYQTVAVLTIGELWAVAITLRIALIDHLCPLAGRIVEARVQREEADALAERLLAAAAEPGARGERLVHLTAAELDGPGRLKRAFVVQLFMRLRDRDPMLVPIFAWLEERLEEAGTSSAQVIQLDQNRLAASQVTVENIITSMRLLQEIDWRDFVEDVSHVEAALRTEGAGVYPAMDFATRNTYRHAVERLAKRSPHTELEIAQLALAAAGAGEVGSARGHVGYNLIGDGRYTFRRSLGYREGVIDLVCRLAAPHLAGLYLGLLGAGVAAMVGVAVWMLGSSGVPLIGLLLFGLLVAIPASELAVAVLQHVLTAVIPPKLLPRMETKDGIPGTARTFVVIPTLLTDPQGVDALLEALHLHSLANHDPTFFFALLTDFTDADAAATPTDGPLLRRAEAGVRALNTRYPTHGVPRFHLFHRARLWNAAEGAWMGFERKRGKIAEFNRLLRGATDTSYVPGAVDAAFLSTVEYVITLDSDTQLPRGTARRLVGTALHPLNQPRYDVERGRVVEGYGILQPRVSVSLESALRTRFARVFSGITGMDPYSPVVSEVYQDLFGEGSFTGKGLYVVDTFEEAMTTRVPENALLSHDLFESVYARSGLVSDVELFDDFPADHGIYLKRQHRWIRGDWQLFPWLFPWVPDTRGGVQRNQLPLLSRWKILDNLRRSLVAPAVLLWLILVWVVLPATPWRWTTMIVLVYAYPIYAKLIYTVTHYRRGISLGAYVQTEIRAVGALVVQIGVNLALLPDQAVNNLDAILRALYRKLVSHRMLLEWVSFAHFQRSRSGCDTPTVRLAMPSVFALLVGAAVLGLRPSSLGVASPFLVAWVFSPLLKRRLSRPPSPVHAVLRADQITTLRGYARRTWHFFEVMMQRGDHWLPPDNFQEDPTDVVAHRTSPTNIGLALLATTTAFEFGYIGLVELLDRLENTLGSVERLAKYRGHLFNWYDTQSLQALRPAYVSTVDSGNLAAHLLAVRQCCEALAREPWQPRDPAAGLRDTCDVLDAEVRALDDVGLTLGAASVRDLREVITSLRMRLTGVGVILDPPALQDLAARLTEAADIFAALGVEVPSRRRLELSAWLEAARQQVDGLRRDHVCRDGGLGARAPVPRLQAIADRCDQLFEAMDFRFLFSGRRQVFSIGFDVAGERLDGSFYDILASEARLTSFITIAKGDVSADHWFRLSRQMTPVHRGRALISWTATMFEYLMPLLVMRRYEGSLLDETYTSIVARQREYGEEQDVPWGVSESGYNARDLQLNYQYGPFGVPGLGLRRGLSADLVISPYSSLLAAMIDPVAALKNLHHLVSLGALGRFGFYEALDYTTERLPPGQPFALVRSFMAHHQGMSLVALGNLLNERSAREHFHAEPRVMATRILLQEKIPQATTLVRPRAEEVHPSGPFVRDRTPNLRVFGDNHAPTPRVQLLGNGVYSVLVTTAGAGYSRCGEMAVGRWREDTTRDSWGQFIYVRARHDGAVWSAGHQPLCTKARRYEATFAEDKVEIRRQDGDVLTHTEIVVSPEDNVELRRVSLVNLSHEARVFEVTSYLEVVLALPAADDAHPAFSNLFIETEYVASEDTLLATRRRREAAEAQVWAFHVAIIDGETAAPSQFETERGRFLGRGRDPSHPAAILDDRPLSNTVGAVLDPIFAVRQTVRIPAGKTARITFATGVAGSREDALRLADKHHDVHIFERETALAWTKSQVQLRHLGIDADLAHAFQRLAGRILYSDPSLRPHGRELARNRRTQSDLWRYGIGGDLPLVLTCINDDKDVSMVRELLRAHELLRLRGLVFDLVILNADPPSYAQGLQDELLGHVRVSGSAALLEKAGGVYILRAEHVPPEDVALLRAVARVNLDAARGPLVEQLQRRPPEPVPQVRLLPHPGGARRVNAPLMRQDLSFFNGLGGFTEGGREYHILLREGQWTPAPWINVLANGHDFGTQVSEAGSGFTWSQNSRENRLTPWSNDPIGDAPGEVLYLRDEDSGEVWTPTPLPIREVEPYLICHGQGYSTFTHHSHGIEQVLEVFVPLDDSVKVCVLRLKNTSPEPRHLTVTGYTEWVLGVARAATAPSVWTEVDAETGVLFARNPYHPEFGGRVAFVHMPGARRGFSCDRTQFIGRNGNLRRPRGLLRSGLAGQAGAGLDPCAVVQVELRLAPGEERTVVHLLGQCADVGAALDVATRYSDLATVAGALARVKAYWDEVLGTIEVHTPEPAMDLLLNRWLLYQTLVCRLWARSALYQAGGAFGFRDQLQDVMALVHAQPETARAQIVRAAGRQFPEGDVQHWWHPPSGRGVRTAFSDDRLWLPYVVGFYIEVTGDRGVLDERAPFLLAPPLEPGQESAYGVPGVSEETATVLEHCARALDRSLAVGRHGLPLMGGGDWNDGMNRVGLLGEGESVWVAWFLFATLKTFLPHLARAGEGARAATYTLHLEALKRAVEAEGWDGAWYRRAYFDDGTPLGSATNAECQIDSIAQTWAVLSGAADPERARRAMASVYERLVDRDAGLIRLFTPPFDRGAVDPGYIKGYVPGVRENGGQYTHAAIWTVMAAAALGDGDRAGELFSLLNPIHHASTRAGLHRYKVEPYVIAADVYGKLPHVGRGGWTWYTGSASWMYRAGLESLLGFHRVGETLHLRPCIPSDWREFEIHYHHHTSLYHVTVHNPHGITTAHAAYTELDGQEVAGGAIPLADDGRTHRVVMTLR